MGPSVITPEDVLESLMNDGTIDAIRLKIINQLKGNIMDARFWGVLPSEGSVAGKNFSTSVFVEELKRNTITMVEQSKVLNTPGAEKQTKRELFDLLRRELETPVLEKASKAVWELILDNSGLGKEISEVVERVYRRLSGIDLPPPPPPPPPPLPLSAELETQDERREAERVKDVQIAESSGRKRTFNEMNAQESTEAVPNGSSDHPPAL
ncbi:hypothetical protein AXF42_Ash000358 [Apostasia shenzhenica]|uniref:Uncharacterized protein n=1 Tax=Apostasia shenzhenica TaxID=1088818 RepID=A0A2I0AG39_9ASPA|nr:hypothetical protein AXF42_Ash000358 [Apostasia shenzhenica]